jgi:hypothetical protein
MQALLMLTRLWPCQTSQLSCDFERPHTVSDDVPGQAAAVRLGKSGAGVTRLDLSAGQRSTVQPLCCGHPSRLLQRATEETTRPTSLSHYLAPPSLASPTTIVVNTPPWPGSPPQVMFASASGFYHDTVTSSVAQPTVIVVSGMPWNARHQPPALLALLPPALLALLPPALLALLPHALLGT